MTRFIDFLVPVAQNSYNELEHNAEAVKADVRALFGPHACRAAVLTFLCIQRKRLPADCRIHKDVLRYMVGPMFLATGYNAEWRRERVDAGARVPVKKIKR